jgi:2-keto-4-pentenoate hydratase/2-oxohepta-3-ene-1,7-dioic acid hydratase in catechol pathway
MRFCRFGDGRLGLVEGPNVRDVTTALDVLPAYRHPLPTHDVLIANLDRVAERAMAIAPQSPSLPLASLKLLSPVANPGKIIGAPVNYRKHLEEVIGDPEIHYQNKINEIQKAGVFLKATSSLAGPGEGIALRKLDRRNDHEVELVFVIGKQANHVSRAEALKYVAGYAIGLDITIRGPEERSLRKSPDSYTILGPWLVTADEIPNPGNLDLGITVNGDVRQSSNTKYIITGTPEGVSPIVPGDVVVASIEKIGTMEVKVRAASDVSAIGHA